MPDSHSSPLRVSCILGFSPLLFYSLAGPFMGCFPIPFCSSAMWPFPLVRLLEACSPFDHGEWAPNSNLRGRISIDPIAFSSLTSRACVGLSSSLLGGDSGIRNSLLTILPIAGIHVFIIGLLLFRRYERVFRDIIAEDLR